jgi:hypothetical protein
MALAFPLARDTGPQVTQIDRGLTEITARMAAIEDLDDERRLLDTLMQQAAEVERLIAATSYRFGAARAYHALVERRVAELREERIPGLQTISEFMERRFAPAMRTCESTVGRLEALAERVARASNLLRTRVDIALEGQNRDLLQSMNRRAWPQLRLQQTVEGCPSPPSAITRSACRLRRQGGPRRRPRGRLRSRCGRLHPGHRRRGLADDASPAPAAAARRRPGRRLSRRWSGRKACDLARV